MIPARKPKRAPRPRNPVDPREKACRERCEAYKIPSDAVHEGKPMWARFLDEVEAALIAEESQKPTELKGKRYTGLMQ